MDWGEQTRTEAPGSSVDGRQERGLPHQGHDREPGDEPQILDRREEGDEPQICDRREGWYPTMEMFENGPNPKPSAPKLEP